MSERRVLYISDGGPQLSVFASQVLGMYRAWSAIYPTDLFYRHRGDIDPSIPGTALEMAGSAARVLLRREIRTNNLRQKIGGYAVIHCRGVIAAWLALKAIPEKQRHTTTVLLDCRGLLVEELGFSWRELFHRPAKALRHLEYRRIEQYAIDQCDLLLTVSEPMSEFFREKLGRSADAVIPCIVDETRFRFDAEVREAVRRRLALGERRVFLYVGGVDVWQRLDLVGAWWRHHSRSNPDDLLLVLTRHRERFLDLSGLKSAEAGEVRFDFVPHDQMPAYLSAADYGLMFRDESIVNRVSSPVKLSEYLASGLMVLSNQDYFAARDRRRIVLVNPLEPGDAPLPEETADSRLAASQAACRLYSAERAVATIIRLLPPDR